MSSTKNIFAIYSSQDKEVLQHLLLHLQPLKKDFNIAIWSDDAIARGERWKPRDVSRLAHADIFLLLLSHSFMYSEFIKQDEFKMVIDRYKEGKAVVIPMLLDDCPWDVEFTSDDYTFNFRELQVFRKDEKSIGDWSPTDEIFKHVTYYVRGLLTSSTQKSALEKPVNKDGKKLLNLKKEGQIAIDFFEEREVHNIAEWERKRKKEAEAKEVIRKEKRLRQKAESQKRIEKEVEAKRVVQEEIRDNEAERSQMAVEEKRHGELEKVERETQREKRLVGIVAPQEKVTRKNGLARYNYQFKTAKVVEAKRVARKERRGNEEAKAKMAVEEKRRDKITKSLREKEREKRLREIVAVQEKVANKKGLARYNYQFKTAKVVEAKRVVQEERQGNETKALMAVVEKGRAEILKFLREADLGKRLEEIVAALKGVMKKYGPSRYNYRFKTSKVVGAKKGVQDERRGNEEPKAKIAVEEKGRGEIKKSLRETVWEKRPGEMVAALKRVIKKNRFAVQNYQVKITTAINQFVKKATEIIGRNKKRRVRPIFVIAALVIFGILIYIFTGDSEKPSTTLSEIEETEVDPDAGVNTKTNPVNQAAATLKLGIGDSYKGGIIFAIDPSNKTGKIASMDDAGPMTWNSAMTIHEQLGEGWRLPTLDELQLMYKNIGQGADNRGEFADELYWSATPFDEYQARLLRFSDGNASYHFNSTGTHRKFRVRAIQDFKR